MAGRRNAISIWNIYLPAEEDRDSYVRNCYRTGTVTLINTNNEVIHKVPIGKLALQMIQFPDDPSEDNPIPLGSIVSCGNVRGHNQPFVLDVYEHGNEFNHIEENEFRIIKKKKDNKAEISLRGKKGIATISVHSDEADGGQLHIRVTHADGESGLAKVSVSGEVEIEATGLISAKSSKGVLVDIYDGNEDEKRTTLKYTALEGLSYSDEFENSITVTEEAIQIISAGEVVKLGEGTEKMVLGDTLAQLLKDFITEVSIAQTASGPLLNAAAIAAYVGQVDTILSAYSNTD